MATGSNKTYQQKGDRGRVLGEPTSSARLHRAIEKAHGDRDQAVRNICRLCGVKAIDALPVTIRAATLALIDA